MFGARNAPQSSKNRNMGYQHRDNDADDNADEDEGGILWISAAPNNQKKKKAPAD